MEYEDNVLKKGDILKHSSEYSNDRTIYLCEDKEIKIQYSIASFELPYNRQDAYEEWIYNSSSFIRSYYEIMPENGYNKQLCMANREVKGFDEKEILDKYFKYRNAKKAK